MQAENKTNPLKKFIRLVTFIDLPIKKKFTLFGVGVLFWFGVVAAVAIAALFAINFKYNWVITNAVPQGRMVQKVIRNLQDLSESSSRILQSQQSETAKLIIEQAQLRQVEIRSTLSELVLGTVASGKEPLGNNLNSLLTKAMNREQQGRGDYLRQITEQVSFIGANADRFYNLRLQAFSTGGQQQELQRQHQQLTALIETAINLSHDYSTGLSDQLSLATQTIKKIISYTITCILVVLIIYALLHLIFTLWISNSIAKPVEAIVRQIHSLGTGDIDLTQKIEITTTDEIGKLSAEFNDLMETVYGMTMFKKVIEEDSTLDDIYSRLAEVFENTIGIPEFVIYEVNDNQREMQNAFPAILPEEEQACSRDIFSDCDLCRAKKTGHNISSVSFPGICKQFKADSGKRHICIPLNIGGKVSGVAQFLFPVTDEKLIDVAEMHAKMFKAETYINQSLSVIEAKRLMNTLRDNAQKDSLTGLYNRRFLQDHSNHIVAGTHRRKKNIGLLMCDLDYFKQVNDQHGHDIGDLVLKETSALISQAVRETDVVIRFGGEEFLILLIDIEPGDAMPIAEKIRTTLEEKKISIPGGSLKKTISLGVSEFPHDGDGFWQVIKYADVALYQAKETGRNKSVRFTPEMWKEEEF